MKWPSTCERQRYQENGYRQQMVAGGTNITMVHIQKMVGNISVANGIILMDLVG